jgi:hypothetical protein
MTVLQEQKSVVIQLNWLIYNLILKKYEYCTCSSFDYCTDRAITSR